jgi:hypothetical protein
MRGVRRQLVHMLLALLPVAAVAAHSPPQQFQGTEVVVVAARGAHACFGGNL